MDLNFQMGPSWAEVGALLAELTPSRANVADMLDRGTKQRIWTMLGRPTTSAITKAPCAFFWQTGPLPAEAAPV